VGQFFVGLLIGAVWSPCVGPAFGSALALAASADTRLIGILSIASFGVGVSVPLLMIAYSTRSFVFKRERIARINRVAQPLFGMTLVSFGLAVLTGYDKVFEAAALEFVPEWMARWMSAV
jgi:cytochrome c-type biogenesis protein